jgi:4-amino-4-deoxy-L-arabinose transferase-like glycosyltransferase
VVSDGVGEDTTPSVEQRTGRLAWWVVGVPVVLAALARAAYWRFVTPGWVPDSDADQYLRIARSLARGQGYSLIYPQLERHPTAFRPPLYPTLVSLQMQVTGTDSLWGVRLLSLLLGVAVVGLLGWFALQIAGPVAAAVAGTAAALSPQLIANDTVSLSEPLSLVLLMAVLILLHERRPLACGAAAGLLLLTRPNAYLVVAVMAVALWRTVGWRRAAAATAISLAILAPWMVRNQLQVGTLRPTTSDGFTLAAIYAPEARAQGTFVDPVLDPAYNGTDVELLALGDEGAWSAGLTDLALESIREHPGYVAQVVARNLGALFELPPSSNDGPEELDGRNPDFRSATIGWFYLVTLAGISGLFLERRRRELWPALAITAQFVVLSLLLVSTPRLRAPFDLVMCLGAGLLVAHVTRDLARARTRNRGEVGSLRSPPGCDGAILSPRTEVRAEPDAGDWGESSAPDW